MTKQNDLNYQDDWAAGWNLARCGYPLAEIEKTQATNHVIERPNRRTTGLVDGWNAREEAAKLAQQEAGK